MCPGRHMIAWSGRVTYIMTQPGPAELPRDIGKVCLFLIPLVEQLPNSMSSLFAKYYNVHQIFAGGLH